jgi:hypothetical protein
MVHPSARGLLRAFALAAATLLSSAACGRATAAPGFSGQVTGREGRTLSGAAAFCLRPAEVEVRLLDADAHEAIHILQLAPGGVKPGRTALLASAPATLPSTFTTLVPRLRHPDGVDLQVTGGHVDLTAVDDRTIEGSFEAELHPLVLGVVPYGEAMPDTTPFRVTGRFTAHAADDCPAPAGAR